MVDGCFGGDAERRGVSERYVVDCVVLCVERVVGICSVCWFGML